MLTPITTSVLLLASVAFAFDDRYQCVTIETTKSMIEAVKIAKKAAQNLKCQLDEESLTAPRQSEPYWGFGVSIHFSADSEYVVTTYVGGEYDKTDLRSAARTARKYFKDAGISTVTVSDEQLQFDFSLYRHAWFIILGSQADYHSARALAEQASQKTGVNFSSRGHVFDPGRGLIWPGESEDDVYAGGYYERRYNDECDDGQSDCITIEESGVYEGFVGGFYIVVGGIYDDQKEANIKLKEFKKVIPDAYIKDTVIYMGCRS